MRQMPRIVAGLLLALFGCTDEARPPRAQPLERTGESSGGPSVPIATSSDDVNLIFEDSLHPATESPCGATTVALEFQRPNFYFVLDGSGSMLDAMPTGANLRNRNGEVVNLQTRYDATIWSVENVLAAVGHRVNFGASVFPGEGTTCGAGEEVFPLSAGDTVSYAVAGTYGPILREMLFGLHRHTPEGGTPVAATLDLLRPQLVALPQKSYVFLLTDGAPNCNDSYQCTPEYCLPNLEEAVLYDLQGNALQCEAPTNCCDANTLGQESCLDEPGSLQAIESLHQAGIETYIIGIPGSDAYAGVLDSLALAGGTPRDVSPLYYQVSNAAELSETVSQLGRQLALSCIIELAELPPNPTLVNVFFDGQLVEANSDNGWRWQGDLSLELLGSACQLWSEGQVLQTDVVAGCPTVLR